MRRNALVWLVSSATLWASAPALAAGPGVLVAPPTVDEGTPDHIIEALTQGVRAGLTDAGVDVGTAPEGCADATCMAQEVSQGNARAYVTTEVRVTGSDYALVTDILDGNGGSLGRKEGSCEICTYEEAAESLRGLVAEAAADLGPAPVLPGTISVVTDPEGADVSIDGTGVGAAPYEGELAEGPHTVEATKDGYAPARQQVDIVGGQPTSITLALDRQSKLPPPRTLELIGWGAVGAGAAALVAGIALLVIDENPVKSNCSGAHVDADGDCEFRYNTLGGGIGLTVTGVLVAGGGAGLVVYARKQRGGGAPAEVALVPGGLRARF